MFSFYWFLDFLAEPAYLTKRSQGDSAEEEEAEGWDVGERRKVSQTAQPCHVVDLVQAMYTTVKEREGSEGM